MLDSEVRALLDLMEQAVQAGRPKLETLPYKEGRAAVDKMSEDAPDHRVYAGPGQRYEVGAGWSQVAKSSGETYLNLKIGAPEFGPSWLRCRLVKLEHPAEDGATHIALWEPRDR